MARQTTIVVPSEIIIIIKRYRYVGGYVRSMTPTHSVQQLANMLPVDGIVGAPSIADVFAGLSDNGNRLNDKVPLILTVGVRRLYGKSTNITGSGKITGARGSINNTRRRNYGPNFTVVK